MSNAKGRSKRDYYEVLGVGRKADDAALKRAYRDMARQFHPDLNPGDEAEQKFKEVNEAYAVLSDAKQRQRYDRYGLAAFSGDAGNVGFENVVGAFDDLISDLLRRRKKTKERGKELRYTLEVTLEEAAFGCEKTITVPQGKSEKEFVVTIPPASKDGTVRRIRGEGAAGINGGPAGDLHVVVRIREHPVMRPEGYDIWCEVPIGFSQAALGAVVEVPSLDGIVRMRVPEGTQSGRILRMRGKGIPRGGGSGSRGDQLVRLVVETPTNLSDRDRRLLEELGREEGESQRSASNPQQSSFVAKLRSFFGD